ncbi:hypothetical protein NA56DRAFT_738505 [Hyaloscypha hepaticicola]|uniref:Uncharacterized protein n=1 Tax=Hyaloscypha hepaticicola TaxID=2082293 RepID=A0A2J6PGY6_9HELO|nr:hypothetical protein NA56DRAFT_738505 [Hyaloscypha hepaticicola]
MSLPPLVVHSLHTRGTGSNPVNLTALRTEIAPGWVAGPGGRGTWDILYSYDTKFAFWRRKTTSVAIAVFAPEIVVVNAFRQWRLARGFVRALNQIAIKNNGEKFKSWYNQSGNHFDIVYGHFAAMGRFAADVEQIYNVTRRTTITPHGIIFLARRGRFCKVNGGHIQDKSKADLLANGLVCVQVLWVAGQAIERKLAGYPMTLLEIHTLVHVCALLMYGLCFQRLLNVQDQTLVSFEDDQTTLAYMLQTSQSKFPPRYRGFNVKRPYYPVQRGECVMDILDVAEPQRLCGENYGEERGTAAVSFAGRHSRRRPGTRPNIDILSLVVQRTRWDNASISNESILEDVYTDLQRLNSLYCLLWPGFNLFAPVTLTEDWA